MRYSDNYNLKLPQRGVDRANVDDLDSNFEIIDGALADDRQISLLMYDSTSTYNTGDIVGYENPTTHRIRAFRCLEDNVTGPWDATKWAQTTLADEIGTGGGASSLEDLTDTDITSPSNGQTLKYNSTSGKWENASGGAVSDLDDLGDVDITTPSDGDLLTYDAQNDEWVNAPASVPDLGDLGDVTLTTPTEGQILEYDGDEWVNTDAPDVDVTKTATGNPIEISDGASAPLVKCVTEIQGSQDLHGYDKPWVGGSGKNKYGNGDKTFVQAMQNIVLDTPLPAGTYTFSALVTSTDTDNDDCLIQFVSGSAIAASGRIWRSTSNNRVSLSFTWSEGTVDKLNLYAAASYVNGAGDTATYKDIQIESGSTATTYAPYSNICPITAYTEGEIEVVGKNLFDKNANDIAVGYYLIASTGVLSPSQSGYNTSGYIPIEPNTHYTKSGASVAADEYCFYDSAKTFISGLSRTDTTVLSPNNAAYMRFDYKASETDSIQIEKGSTATTYEPYTSTTHTTTYPSAIFRGSEDVVNGEVTSDMPVADMGDLTWSAYTTDTTGHSFYVNVPNGTKSVSSDSSVANMVCGNYETVAFINPSEWLRRDAIICQVPNAQRWIVRDERYSDATSFTSAVTGVKIAYELATPTTSSVTPTNLPIRTLSGYTHIESTTGDMEIEYIAKAFSPITEIVDSQISALQKMMELMLTSARETTMTASANYTTGTLIVACGALYKATTAISSGASLVVGTNITQTTIAAELAALA